MLSWTWSLVCHLYFFFFFNGIVKIKLTQSQTGSSPMEAFQWGSIRIANRSAHFEQKQPPQLASTSDSWEDPCDIFMAFFFWKEHMQISISRCHVPNWFVSLCCAQLCRLCDGIQLLLLMTPFWHSSHATPSWKLLHLTSSRQRNTPTTLQSNIRWRGELIYTSIYKCLKYQHNCNILQTSCRHF